MSLRAVLFDHDGTLVDSEPRHFQAWNAALAPYGVVLSEALYREHYSGIATQANANDLVQRFGLRVDASALAREKSAILRAGLAQQAFALMPGAREAVLACRGAGLQLAVVTGASAAEVDNSLQAHALQQHFALIVANEDVARGKPHPDGYRLALQGLGLAASHCLAIEDTAHGVQAARAAGIDCLAIPNSYSQSHDFSAATTVLRDLVAATQFVQRRLQGDRRSGQ